jgi:hypothetical protein
MMNMIRFFLLSLAALNASCTKGFVETKSLSSQVGAVCAGSECQTTRPMNNLALLNQSQYVASLASCLGVKIQANTRRVATQVATSLSKEGAITDISAPTLMNSVVLAGEVCEDLLVAQENAPARAKMFSQIDFSGDPQAITVSAIKDAVHNLARSCYGRDETTVELSTVQDAMVDVGLSSFGAGPQATAKAALFL